MLDAFCRAAFRKQLHGSIEELQGDLDVWRADCNASRPHQGRRCDGRAPMRTFLDAAQRAREGIMRH